MEPIQKFFTKEDEIEDGYEYKFDVMEEGLYLIEINASGKSWWQNFLKIKLGDDDLTVKVDGIEFPKLNGKKGLFDGEVAWNGNNLKGLSKTNIFIARLTKGEHTLHFLVDQNPILKSIKIKKVDSNEINYIPDRNNPAEDGNRRQWMTIVLVDLALKHLAITALCKKYTHPNDDDDLKLIIDGKIQANPKDKKHYFSFWCGVIDNGKEKEFSRELNFSQGTHYIELVADRMPRLKNVVLKLIESGSNEEETVSQVKAKVVWQQTTLRQKPDQNSPAIIENIFLGQEVFVLEKAVKGLRPLSSSNIPLFSDRWHKIQFEGKEGYLYSEALEIEGENADTIKKFIIEKSQELDEDGNLILAIAERESKFFPYSVSQVVDEYRQGRGVLQLTDQTREEMRGNKNIGYDLKDPYDFRQNIEGGIIYLKFIRSLFKENTPDYLEKLLVAWNQGPYSISAEERDKPLDYDKLLPEPRKFIQEVKKFYNKYRELNQGKIKIFTLFFILATTLLVGSFSYYFYAVPLRTKVLGLEIEKKYIPRGKTVLIKSIQNEESREEFFKLRDDLDGNSQEDEVDFHFYYGRPLERLTDITFQDQKITVNGYPSAYTVDINKDGVRELVVELGVGASSIQTEIYRLRENLLEAIPIVFREGQSGGFLNKSGVRLLDDDGDGILEVHEEHNWIDIEDRYESVYKYSDGKFIKVSER